MPSVQQGLNIVEQKNRAIQERRAFIAEAASAAMQGILSNPAGVGMEPAAAAELAQKYATALADRVKQMPK